VVEVVVALAGLDHVPAALTGPRLATLGCAFDRVDQHPTSLGRAGHPVSAPVDRPCTSVDFVAVDPYTAALRPRAERGDPGAHARALRPRVATLAFGVR
jgi:hypothetical protein